MLFQVKITTAVYAFDFFETKWKFKLNITSFFGIMCQFYMVVVAVFCGRYAEADVPFQPCFFPMLIPGSFGAWANEKLHFHLFKLSHSKNELAGHNFVAKCFAGLCYAKRNFHSCGLLHIQEIDKNALCRFGA